MNFLNNINCEQYKNKNVILFNNDCRNILNKIPDNSIDLIVTDPPYFIDGFNNNWNDKSLKYKSLKSDVVKGLPIGMKFDRKQGENLQDFMTPISIEFFRILKPGAFCIVFSQARLYHRMAITLDIAGFEIRDMLVWKYEGQAKAFSQTHFIKKDKNLSEQEKQNLIQELEGYKTPQLKPQIEPMVMAQKPRIGTFIENWKKYKLGLINTKESLNNKFPGNVMEVSKQNKNIQGNLKIDHLTVKPVKLISHIIKLFTQEKHIVLDPFMGSGTHGVAALQNNRKFIGIESEAKYFQISKYRIENYKIIY